MVVVPIIIAGLHLTSPWQWWWSRNYSIPSGAWLLSPCKFCEKKLYRLFAWWRHFTTMTRILQGFAFLRKLAVFVLWNLSGITKFKYERKNVRDSGRSSKMTPSCKWPNWHGLHVKWLQTKKGVCRFKRQLKIPKGPSLVFAFCRYVLFIYFLIRISEFWEAPCKQQRCWYSTTVRNKEAFLRGSSTLHYKSIGNIHRTAQPLVGL